MKGQASLRTLKTEQVFLKGRILWQGYKNIIFVREHGHQTFCSYAKALVQQVSECVLITDCLLWACYGEYENSLHSILSMKELPGKIK